MTDIIDELNEKFQAGQTIIRGKNVTRLLARAFDLRSQLEEAQATLTDCLKSEEALRDQLEAVTAPSKIDMAELETLRLWVSGLEEYVADNPLASARQAAKMPVASGNVHFVVETEQDDRPWIDATKLDPDGNRDVEILVDGKKRRGWRGTDEWRIYTKGLDYGYANDIGLTVTHWREISE